MNRERTRIDVIVSKLHECGGELSDKISLDDLCNYHDDGHMLGNPPKSWKEALSGLSPDEKRTVVMALGKVNRIMDKMNRTARVVDLRPVKNKVSSGKVGRYNQALSEDAIFLLNEIFKKN